MMQQEKNKELREWLAQGKQQYLQQGLCKLTKEQKGMF